MAKKQVKFSTIIFPYADFCNEKKTTQRKELKWKFVGGFILVTFMFIAISTGLFLTYKKYRSIKDIEAESIQTLQTIQMGEANAQATFSAESDKRLKFDTAMKIVYEDTPVIEFLELLESLPEGVVINGFTCAEGAWSFSGRAPNKEKAKEIFDNYRKKIGFLKDVILPTITGVGGDPVTGEEPSITFAISGKFVNSENMTSFVK